MEQILSHFWLGTSHSWQIRISAWYWTCYTFTWVR